MKNKYFSVALSSLVVLLAVFILEACSKDDDVITDKVSWEEYLNSSGHKLEITTYFNGATSKTFSVEKDSTLRVLNPMDPGSDTTGTIFCADSAKMAFDDGKIYMLRDTIKTTVNFLNKANFTTAISPTGQRHYYRYTISAEHYNLAR